MSYSCKLNFVHHKQAYQIELDVLLCCVHRYECLRFIESTIHI